MLSLYVFAQTALWSLSVLDPGADHRAEATRRRSRSASGQATAEYALVLLGAAAVALLLAAWAARSGKIGQLFNAVVDQLISKAG